MKRLMLSAMASGQGKTTMTCGILAALKRRGLRLSAFKCGPDYIDPMFHSRVLGIPCRNLDLFLQGKDGLRRTLRRAAGDFTLLEGAMGFYDGVGGTAENSAWQIANNTDTPVILVLRPKGQSITLAAQVRGMLEFRSPSRIAGLLLTDVSPMLHAHLKPILERETGLPVLGYLPPMEEARLESRHLGLVTAGEISDFQQRIQHIADQVERTVDVSGMLSLAAESIQESAEPAACPPVRCRIAYAWDEAFCFYYADSLDALRQAGAELVPFQPLWDPCLPDHIQGIYLGGGYPELYAKQLSDNFAIRRAILRMGEQGIPMLAECGGFLYLQQSLEDLDGTAYPMVGLLPGGGFRTEKLQRFGYVNLAADRDSMLFRAGEPVPAHEFHYWDTTDNGKDLTASKPGSERSWAGGWTAGNLYAGFPHLHLGGELPLAKRFVDAAAAYGEKQNEF